MTDIQGFDWAHTMDILLLGGVILVTIILIVFAFFYLRANRDFDLSLKSLGTQESLAEINRQLLAKKDELERLEKQESALRDNINDLSSKQATVDEVKSQLDQLGMQYSQKRNELADLEQKLIKSKALQDFVESHQKDQLSEIERLIDEKQKRLDELTTQINEQNGTRVMGDALKNAFNAIGEELSDLSGAQATKAQMEQEINDLNAQLSELQAQKNDINQELDALSVKLEDQRIEEQVGKTLGKAFDSLGEELTGLQGLSAQKENLEQKVAELQEQIDDLDNDHKRKSEELAELENQVTEHKVGEQVEQSLGAVFENLTDSLNEQISGRLESLSEELTGLQQISSQKESLAQEIENLQDKLQALKADQKKKAKELADLESQVADQKVEEQVSQSLGAVFENLTDSLNEQISGRLESLSEELTGLQQISSQKESLAQEIENLQDKLQALKADQKKKAKELAELENQVSEQKVEEQVGQSLNDAFTRLSDSINDSMIGLGSGLSQVLELSAQRQKLETENQLLEERNKKLTQDYNKLSGKGETKTERDKAYDALKTEPEQIKTFIDKFDAANTTQLSETEALEQFMRYLRSQDLYYPHRVIKAFHTALKIQDINPLAVLAGISGTGKTQLALRYAEFFGFYSEHVAVQPRWDSKDDLLGFYNFIEEKFQPTPLVRALYQFDQFHIAGKNKQIKNDSPMMMVILDEMNLARVEYYFSEFLSKLELRNSPDYDKSVIEVGSNLNPCRFFVGSNVVIVGTMNDDESTFALSDKVLDRANVLHFGRPESFVTTNEPDVPLIKVDFNLFNQWRHNDNFSRLEKEDQEAREDLKKTIEELNEALDKVGKPFGHRVNNSINAYLKAYPLTDNNDVMTTVKLALADQIEMKIIPKLAGIEQNERSSDCLNRLNQVIEFTNDTALQEAFNEAHKNYNSDGMFIWRGVTRSLDD